MADCSVFGAEALWTLQNVQELGAACAHGDTASHRMNTRGLGLAQSATGWQATRSPVVGQLGAAFGLDETGAIVDPTQSTVPKAQSGV